MMASFSLQRSQIGISIIAGFPSGVKPGPVAVVVAGWSQRANHSQVVLIFFLFLPCLSCCLYSLYVMPYDM